MEGGTESSECSITLLWLNSSLTSFVQADHLETMMRDQLKVQELMDICLDQRDEELRQLWSQSQADGAQLAALSLQVQELISSVETRAEVLGRDLKEINGQFDCHRGKIHCLKIREKDVKEETEKLKGFIVGAGHKAQVFKDCLDRMEENVCRCGRTPSEVGKDLCLLRTKVGRSCPMPLLLGRSMWLLLSQTQSSFLSLLLLPAALVPPPLFLPWKRSLKNLPSSATIWMGS